MKNPFLTFGRVIFALYFLTPHIIKFIDRQGVIQLIDGNELQVIPFLLDIIEVVGALFLILNKYTWFISFLFASLVFILNFYLHDFWNYSGINAYYKMQIFITNFGVFSGLLVLSGYSIEIPLKNIRGQL